MICRNATELPKSSEGAIHIGDIATGRRSQGYAIGPLGPYCRLNILCTRQP